MRRRLAAALLLLLWILSGCSAPAPRPRLTVVATTYPIYLFVNALTQGVDGVQVSRLNTGETSCLHDYTLSVSDMKQLDRADLIALNGADLEEFLEDALAGTSAISIECSQGIELLENLTHDHDEHEEPGSEDHDHGHWDPHVWMDPSNACIMVENLAEGLSEADPEYAAQYEENAQNVLLHLNQWNEDVKSRLKGTEIAGLITFHDGFQYFCHAYGIPLLQSIEEEAGSEASAKEIVEITELVHEYHLPAIFTEVNGSDDTAKAISRETGCAVGQLSMIMDGPDDELARYGEALLQNAEAIAAAFTGEETEH